MDLRSRTRLGALLLVATIAAAACSNAGSSPSPTKAPSATAGASSAAPAATTSAAETPAASTPATTTPAAGTPAASTPPATTAAASTPPATGSTCPATLAGTINISGSSTVLPITTAISEACNATAPGVAITVNGPGTGDGFKTFCKGETDISDASRKIKDEEAAVCTTAGIEYIELAIAIDGISVLTSNDTGEDVKCLTFNDLYALLGPESEAVAKWKDAQALATELGSTTVFPDQTLTITAPGEESGTYDSFIEITLKKIADARTQPNTVLRKSYTASGDDNVIIDGIAGTPYSLGFVGFAYAEENDSKVKELEIDGGKGCVVPSVETISDGTYPVSRTLYIYVNKAKAKDNPAVAPFVDYYLAEGTISAALQLPGVRYINLPAATLEASRTTWTAR